MAKVLLGVTGSVASIKTPVLFDALRAAGHEVRVVATQASLYFFEPHMPPFTAEPGKRDPALVTLDEDEWPGDHYKRGDAVLHIELRRWADVLLVAPLDANTLGKFACGLADNCLTCVWRAWQRDRPIILAPAMNTLMWEHPATLRQLRTIAEDTGITLSAGTQDPLRLVEAINTAHGPLHIVPPQSKRLACDDVGIGAMAECDEIVKAVQGVTVG